MHFSRNPSGPNTSCIDGFDVFSSIPLSPSATASLFGLYSSPAETPSRAGAVAEARFLVSIESFAEFVARLARVLASAFAQEIRWVDNNSTSLRPAPGRLLAPSACSKRHLDL